MRINGFPSNPPPMLQLGTFSSLAARSYKNRAYFYTRRPNPWNYMPVWLNTIRRFQTSTVSTIPVGPEKYTGKSGRDYKIEKTLQEETFPPLRVCLATAGDQKFILKYIHPVNFEDLQDLNNRLLGATHVRIPQDVLPGRSMFVFEYFTGHLLRIAQYDLPLEMTKRILKDALRGLAELHDRDIVHTDIKADNIFIDWKGHGKDIVIDRVQLGDLEDAAYIPPGSQIVGKQAGNQMWRSPEAHASGPLNKSSDVFSFALVCICAIYKRVIFAVGEEELDDGVHPLSIVIERQISYFADNDGIDGLLKHLGDSPWVQVFEVIRDGFNEENPRRPFSLWKNVDEDFKSLICAMTKLDPGKRITAHEALAHKWFECV
ncbi:serine/threonine protein kinase [Nannizzia gypsea CBS 118893]|uniref:Serine/threonine protein kinase n=1 Tax=Arthroderma gypseum (strain ATCC MYA-4604 / CBS 118893) TaxID=535722 RepID=E4UTW1_ARTGP|nr:serine/threonine protein kinase [Nannizzia gypsea CBS 118893]EFR00767.1 serine/threonine protein kinase [Nannizzia gypsea CBS 118893]